MALELGGHREHGVGVQRDGAAGLVEPEPGDRGGGAAAKSGGHRDLARHANVQPHHGRAEAPAGEPIGGVDAILAVGRRALELVLDLAGDIGADVEHAEPQVQVERDRQRVEPRAQVAGRGGDGDHVVGFSHVRSSQRQPLAKSFQQEGQEVRRKQF